MENKKETKRGRPQSSLAFEVRTEEGMVWYGMVWEGE